MNDPQDALRQARIAFRAKLDRLLQLTPAELELKSKNKRRATAKRRRRAKAQRPISRPTRGQTEQAKFAARKRAASRSALIEKVD